MTAAELKAAILNGEVTFSEVALALADGIEHYADSRAELATDSMWKQLASDESYELRQCGQWDADCATLRALTVGWKDQKANENDEEVKALNGEEEE